MTSFSGTLLHAQDYFTKNEVLEDMAFLWASLEEAHYNLYAYTSKAEFEKNRQNSINKNNLIIFNKLTNFF